MPIAWKIDSNLAIVLKSNVTLFTELIRESFIQNTLFINNYLPIIRIESKFNQNGHSDEKNGNVSRPRYKQECMQLLTEIFSFYRHNR